MHPCKVGSAWKIQASAKLNLYLEVLGPRADGFHALETLMVPVRVYDQLAYQPVARQPDARQPSSPQPLSLRVRDIRPGNHQAGNHQAGNQLAGNQHAADFEVDDNNLVLRAARLLAKQAGIEPFGKFDLFKRIPIQAGMGGGSSDAAAALVLANKAWGLGYSRQKLQPLAAELGSDVPFFLSSSAAICSGRGEIVEPVGGLPRLHFVIAKPSAGLSTIEVFRQLRQRKSAPDRRSTNKITSGLLAALRRGAIADAAVHMRNRLEDAAEQLAPWLTRVRKLFRDAGCITQFLTGSGSAYVGLMRSATHARQVASRLRNQSLGSGMELGHVFATSSC